MKARSYSIADDPEGKVVERDCFTCKHCQRIVFVTKHDPLSKAGASAEERALIAQHEDIGGYCPMCHDNICGPCCDEMAITLKCVPFEMRVELGESREKATAWLREAQERREDARRRYDPAHEARERFRKLSREDVAKALMIG